MMPGSSSESSQPYPPLLALCLALLMCLPAAVALAQTQAQERVVKAAFVFNFAKFTDWPHHSFDSLTDPLRLCIVGHDGLSGELSRLAGRMTKGRTLKVTQLSGNTLPDGCHMAYIALSENRQLASQLSGSPVLTISQIERFSRAGGIIELYQRNGRVRFIINQGAAQRAGLHISSRLLNLAEVIGG